MEVHAQAAREEFEKKFLTTEHISHEDVAQYADRLAAAAEDHGEQKLLYLIHALSTEEIAQSLGRSMEEVLAVEKQGKEELSELQKTYVVEPTLVFARDPEATSKEKPQSSEVTTEEDTKKYAEQEIVVVRKEEELREDAEYRALFLESIERIRRALMEELKKRLTKQDFAMIEGDFQKTHGVLTRIRRVRSQSGVKELMRTREIGGESLRENIIEACDNLSALPPNPHIARISRYDSMSGHVIVEDRPLKTAFEMHKELKQNESSAEQASISRDMLTAFSGCLEGAEYLVKNGIFLQDIKLDNLGRDRENGQGFLFDLDGLVVEGKRTDARISAKKYRPPEWKKGLEYFLQPSEKEMVYQFGVSLRSIAETRHFSVSETMRQFIVNELVPLMTNPEPEKRISIKEALRMTKNMLEEESKEKMKKQQKRRFPSRTVARRPRV